MELPKINKSTEKFNVFGPLKFNNRLPSNDTMLLSHLQKDNLFFKNKLAEFEVRLDNISQKNELKSDSLSFLNNKNSKFNRFNNARLKEKKQEVEEVPALSTSRALQNVPVSARINTARSSILTSRTTDSVSKIDDILENIKKHRRSAVRKSAYDSSKLPRDEKSSLRPKTSANLPQVSNSVDQSEFRIPSHEVSRKKTGKSAKKNRAKTAKEETKKDEDYCHMFYSRSWRIHPELGIIKDKDRTTYDNTQTNFYNTNRQLPETFIFAPDWV